MAGAAECLQVAEIVGIAAPLQRRHVVDFVAVGTARPAAPVVAFKNLAANQGPSTLVKSSVKSATGTPWAQLLDLEYLQNVIYYGLWIDLI